MRASMLNNMTRGQAALLLCLLAPVGVDLATKLRAGHWSTKFHILALGSIVSLALWALVRVLAKRDVIILRVIGTALPMALFLVLALFVWPLMPGLLGWMFPSEQ